MTQPTTMEEAYSQEDIEANRAGQLTDEQIEDLKLWSGIFEDSIIIQVMGYVFIVTLVLFSLFLYFVGDSSEDNLLITVLLLGGILAITNFYFTLRSMRKRRSFKRSLTTEQILTLKHVTKKQFTRRQMPDNPSDYWYEYKGDPLVYLVEQYDLMEDDATYTVYYWSAILDADDPDPWRRVLSIEKSRSI